MNNEFKIALHHGPVGNVSVDTGFKLKSDRVTVDTFSGYDVVMLGDIHRKQQLSSYNGKDMPTIWYPGSLIQNNFGENSSKGFLLWDLEKRDCEFIILENDY